MPFEAASTSSVQGWRLHRFALLQVVSAINRSLQRMGVAGGEGAGGGTPWKHMSLSGFVSVADTGMFGSYRLLRGDAPLVRSSSSPRPAMTLP